MSERTQCNYCSLERIRRRAEAAGDLVTVIGSDVYVHPKDVDVKGMRFLADRERYWKAWLMEIPNQCAC